MENFNETKYTNIEQFGVNICKESDSFLLTMIDEGVFNDINKRIRELCRDCVEHGIMLASSRINSENIFFSHSDLSIILSIFRYIIASESLDKIEGLNSAEFYFLDERLNMIYNS